MEKPTKLDWKYIANHDIQSQHIRCHELQPGEKVKELVSSFRKVHSKGIVLINTQNNYDLDPAFMEGMEVGRYPVVVVTKDDGAKLTQLLDSNEQVMAKLDMIGLSREGEGVPAEDSYVCITGSEDLPAPSGQSKFRC